MAKKKINTMITAFRDGFQSVYGARVFTRDFLPAVQAATDAGLRHIEFGGGARFQALFFYCNENAFDMMDSIRKITGPEANLQTLARGINVVGLDSQSRDIIRLHAKLFKKHGTTTIRNFDALNDINNLAFSGRCIHEEGLKHEIVISMMELPPGCTGAHDAPFYLGILQQILDDGVPFSSLCFKDASGTAAPNKVYETIKGARKMIGNDIPIRFHSHETAGIGIIAYKAAIDGGADGLDLSMDPVSGGTCQPDVVTMWHALRGTEYELDIDIDKVLKVESVFKDCMKDYFMPPESKCVEPTIPWAPMPGGALTANTQMMRDNNILDRYHDVIAAMGEVVRLGGFGTSVTPVSQFYFQQAFNNVMFGPWKKIAEGYGKMVLGYFGKTPAAPDPDVVRFAAEQLQLEPTTRCPMDINDEDPRKGIAAATKLLRDSGIAETEENIFIAAACKEKGITFLKGEATTNVRKKVAEVEVPVAKKDTTEGCTVTIAGKPYSVLLQKNTAIVNGVSYDFEVSSGMADSGATATGGGTTASNEGTAVNAPLPSTILRIPAKLNQQVTSGDVLIVLESMKMEIEVRAENAGQITGIAVKPGDKVIADQAMIYIK